MQGGDHGAIGGVERREQAGGAVADVVVGALLGHARHHRERRLGPGQGLDLGLLVHRQHDRALGRVQVEPDDVEDLLHEQRVVGQLERLGAVRLELERLPDPPDTRARQPDSARPSSPATSASRSPAWTPTCDHDHVLDLLGGDRRRTTRARIVGQPVQTGLPRTGPATCRPSAPQTPARAATACCPSPQRRPARSATATPTPAPTCAAGPTAATAHARHRSAPTRLSDVQYAAYPFYDLTCEILAQDTSASRSAGSPSVAA